MVSPPFGGGANRLPLCAAPYRLLKQAVFVLYQSFRRYASKAARRRTFLRGQPFTLSSL